MPNLDPATRARLADALEGATPERLAEYASHCVELVALCGEGDPRIQTFNTLAALALAVAEGHHLFLDHCGASHDLTLPSALAALLRTTEGA